MHHPIAARCLIIVLYFIVAMPIASWLGRRLGERSPK